MLFRKYGNAEAEWRLLTCRTSVPPDERVIVHPRNEELVCFELSAALEVLTRRDSRDKRARNEGVIKASRQERRGRLVWHVSPLSYVPASSERRCQAVIRYQHLCRRLAVTVGACRVQK